MKLLPLIAFCLFLPVIVSAQGLPLAGQTVLVVPFENRSTAPGIEWIGDSFPELLQENLNSPTLYLLPREDRLRAYDRLGIPSNLRPSRATLYRLAEQLDVDYLVLGDYSFDGRVFTTTAQLLDMRRPHLSPPLTESGPLPQLIEVETALSWDILHSLFADFTITREAYLSHAPTIRLDAFENCVKGVAALRAEQQIQYFKEAVRVNPDYGQALLQLGQAYYRDHQYQPAIDSLDRVPQQDPLAGEADFYLGLAAYDKGDFVRAESAFSAVASRLPLPEIYNNLGVVVDHRDKQAALAYFQKAVEEDPNDADYHFNLGIELHRTGDLSGSTQQLRETLALKPEDVEAESLLNSESTETPQRTLKLPAERLRGTYDESSFRQLVLKIGAAAEQRLAKADALTHAQFHTDRGHQFLNQGFVSEAEREFREAIALNAASAEAHAGLASVLEAKPNEAEARSEAEEALRLRPFAEPLLVLARLDLRDNKAEAAANYVEQALRLDPNSAAAQALKRAVAAKLAQEAQPLPN